MSRSRAGAVTTRGNARNKLMKKVVNDIVQVNKATKACFDPKSEKCQDAIGKNGDYMKNYFKYRKDNDTPMKDRWIKIWDKAIIKNNNAKSKVKIKNIEELRKLPTYKIIKEARERWYNERLKEEPSTTRSGKVYGKGGKRYKELQLKF